MLVPTAAALEAWIADMTADSTWLGGCSVGLYVNVITPSDGTLLSNLVEANYDGYARKVSHTWGTVFKDPNGLYSQQAQQLVFQPTGSSTMNTCQGLFVTGSDSTKLLGVEPFNAPIPLTGPLTNITITLRVGNDAAGKWGFSVIAP